MQRHQSTSPTLNRALEAVHHLADRDPPWADILESSRQLIGSDSVALLLFNDHGEILALHQRNVNAAAEREYVQHFYAHDIVAPIAFAPPASNSRKGNWFDSQEMFTPTLLSGDRYYVDFMCRHRMRQMWTLTIETSPARRGGITFHRETPIDRARDHLESPAIRAFTAALEDAMAERRSLSSQWLSMAESVFGAFGEATCLTTPTGQVLALSQEADRLMSEWSALQRRDGRLWHADPKMRDALGAALRRAATGTGLVRLTLPGGHGGLCKLEMTRADTALCIGGEALVFIRIRRPTLHDEHPPVELLCMAFGVTPAEGRVLIALIKGHSATECADLHGVSIHTVRKQIAILMEKMHCKRQVDLVRKGLGLM